MSKASQEVYSVSSDILLAPELRVLFVLIWRIRINRHAVTEEEVFRHYVADEVK